MSGRLTLILATAHQVPTAPGPSLGKWVFVAALALLLLWLVLMPRRLIGQASGVPPWWRNVRIWAIVVTVIQICIYAFFG
jgi:hypothetical protein